LFFELGVMEDASVKFEDAFEAACGFYSMLDLQMTLVPELDAPKHDGRHAPS
jgi:hypothetical protein